MTDYRSLVTREPPAGLLMDALPDLDTGGLVYEAVRVPAADQMIQTPGNAPKTKKMVKVTCSECGGVYLAECAQGEGYTYSGKKSSFGFVVSCPDTDELHDGDNTLCPMCGAPVIVKRASGIGRGRALTDETCIMTASLLDGERGERPLVLTCWWLRHFVDRYGEGHITKDAVEAYVFDRDGCQKLSGWTKAYSGTVGYYMAVRSEWTQPKDWSESFGQVSGIVGLTQELVEESCLYNSKLYEYMMAKNNTGWKSPVAYLRAYQKWPQVENLVVQGLTRLLDRMLDNAMKGEKWEENKKGLPKLPDLNLKERRPAQMLGLTKEELRRCKDNCWDLFHLHVFRACKAAGDRLTERDMYDIHCYGAEDIISLVGRAPLGKVARYMLKQCDGWQSMILDETPEDEDEDETALADGAELMDATFLGDYWDMAERIGWDLTDPAVRWPKDLIAAHDGAMAAYAVVKTEALREAFRREKQKLMRYAYTSGDLTITPAGSQEALNYESAILGHCVKTYGEDCANGKTAILFVRHSWAPGVPYFTLNLDVKQLTVIQNRGRHNCPRTPEVKAFEAEWLKWVRNGCKRKKDGTPVGSRPPIRKRPAETEKVVVA